MKIGPLNITWDNSTDDDFDEIDEIDEIEVAPVIVVKKRDPYLDIHALYLHILNETGNPPSVELLTLNVTRKNYTHFWNALYERLENKHGGNNGITGLRHYPDPMDISRWEEYVIPFRLIVRGVIDNKVLNPSIEDTPTPEVTI